MTELATPPVEQEREGLTRISHWICGSTIANVSSRWRKAWIADDE